MPQNEKILAQTGPVFQEQVRQPNQEDLVDLLTHHDVETTRSLQALTLDLSAFSRQKNLDK